MAPLLCPWAWSPAWALRTGKLLGRSDGSMVAAPYYLGSVTLSGLPPLTVTVTALGGEPIVGMDVLRWFVVCFHRGRVLTVEP